MITLIKRNMDGVAQLCRRFGVRRPDLFGSAASGMFTEESDLDFVVDFADRSPGYAMRYLHLAEALETLLGRSVHLVTERSIRSPWFRDSVEQHKVNVYAAGVRQAVAGA